MDRREVLMGGAAALALGVVAKAEAASHNHAMVQNPLGDSASQCIQSGQACLQHCLQLLGTGDTSMSDCSKAVSDMLNVTNALLALSYAGSKFTKPLAKVVAEVTKVCETACRKHYDHHAVCKACADCCADLQAQIAKL